MKKLMIPFLFILFLTSMASAEILINQQPGGTYNLGETIDLPITVKVVEETQGILKIDLLCTGSNINFYKNGVDLAAGEEKTFDAFLVLEKEVIQNLKGNCKMKAILKEDYTLTNEFKVSNLIEIELEEPASELNPGEVVAIKGTATREDGKAADGFISLEIIGDSNETTLQEGSINNGFFEINTTLKENAKAGKYLIKINAYEKAAGDVETNKGFVNYNLQVNQIPTNVEVVFESAEINPGETLRAKAILHDQTGEPIESTAFLTLKDEKDKIIEQVEKPTGEYLEYLISNQQAPGEWNVVAVSTQLSDERNFTILEKEDIAIEIINRTLTIANTGNVLYNNTVLIKIGNESMNIDVFLEVGEEKKYLLSAPDGKYQVEVGGLSEDVLLTGGAIGVKEISEGAIAVIRHPISWIFMLLILALVAYVIYTRVTKKSFFGYMTSKMPKKMHPTEPLREKALVKSSSKAVLSLSIKGEKQKANVICLRVKNLKELQMKKGNAEETLQKVVNLAESKKAFTYESQNNIFFILTPTITKTFKNERDSIGIAQEIKRILDEHNKLFKDRIDSGLSINVGTIVAKNEGGELKFMSMGTLMNTSRKMAHFSKGEVLISDGVRGRVMTEVKTEKKQLKGLTAYSIVDVKKESKSNKKFIRNFLNRIEGESKKPVHKTKKPKDISQK